jgi:hypothetical protein
VAEAQGELEVRAARLDAVADADDLEGLGVALGHAGDHVRDERPGEPVQGPVLPLVVGALHPQRAVLVVLDGDRRGDRVAEFALGPLHADRLTVDGDVHATGHGDRESSDP